MKISFVTKVSSRGEISPISKEKLFNHAGKRIKVTIEDYDQRTILQNAFFHGPILDWWIEQNKILSGEVMPQKIAKNHLKKAVHFYEEISYNGKKYRIPKETSKLSKKEFSELYNQINQFGVEWFKCPAPTPDF